MDIKKELRRIKFSIKAEEKALIFEELQSKMSLKLLPQIFEVLHEFEINGCEDLVDIDVQTRFISMI